MPSPEDILRGLGLIANRFVALAVAWHVVVALVIGWLVVGARPGRHLSALGLAVPLISVSTLAWSVGNPFNGAVFAAVAVALVVVARRLPRTPVAMAPSWVLTLGGVALAYAWVYPHFLEGGSLAWYLVAAPMGLLPCPTLSMVLGFGLLTDGLGSRAWSLVVAGIGLFYALFGMFRLGVWLDVGLLAAAVAMFAVALRSQARR